jgi:O-antigen/teichoic acid export membrane protein
MRLLKLSQLKNKNFLALAGNGTISAISVLTISVLYRAMPQSSVGVWFFFLSVYGLADALRNGLLSTATIKFYAGTEGNRAASTLGSVWFLAIALSGAMMLINLCIMPFMGYIKDQQIILVVKWFGVTVLSSLTYNVVCWKLVADEDYITILQIRMINSISMILLILAMAFFKRSTLENLLWINFLTNCLTSLFCFVFGYSQIKSIFQRTASQVREIIAFGKYSLATTISSNLLGSINTFIITFFLGPGALAVYNLPFKLMEFIEIPLRSFVGTGMSSMAIAHNTNNMSYLAYVSKKYAGMLTLVFIPLAVIAFFGADIAVLLLGGKKYVGTEAANIFRLFMFFAILYPIDRFNGATLDIIHLPKINFYKVLIMLVVTAIATTVGISIFKNIYGVAIAVPFPLIAGLAFGYYHLRKHIDYSIKGILTTGYRELTLLIGKFVVKKTQPVS